MLLICAGPDSFRAQRKAQELERVFCDKYDPNHSSVERIENGKGAIEAVAERVNTVSLFSPRRFLRTTNLLTGATKAQQEMLAKTLAKEPENVIVVSLEEELPAWTKEKTFTSRVKVIFYEYPFLKGNEFTQWVNSVAAEIGVDARSPAVRQLISIAGGDSWLVWNEIQKLGAGGEASLIKLEDDCTAFQYAEWYLAGQQRRREILQNKDGSSANLSTLLGQTRSALRVRDGAEAGIHPFVIKKMRAFSANDLEQAFAGVLLTLFMQRNGLADETESALLLR